ncbi:MAG: SDR family oxidoreductase [Bacteroidales bacterium]|nr:SDR family oxidoreductase [Bacteroidales bacterium]
MIALITGASRGIGFETAKFFIQHTDLDIYALSRNREGLDQLVAVCKGKGIAHRLYPVVYDLEQMLSKPEKIWEVLPADIQHVDILINNAGFLVNKPFEQQNLQDIERMYRVNFLIPALLIKELMPVLGKKGISHIINIGSMGGYQGSVKFAGLAFYSSSKASLACLTECLSQEYKGSDIVFNCLALGSVQTEMVEEAFPGFRDGLSPARMAEFIGNFALTGHQYFRGKIIPVSSSTP